MKHVDTAIAIVALVIGGLLAFDYRRALQREQRAPILAPCPALFKMSHNSADSLYVAVNRGDCVTVP